jgi:predicted AAA+ superfamily ATPase
MKYIERTNYLNRLIGLKNTPDIKIITGIRRSGKSELMRAYINYLKTNEPKANIIYLDFYDLEYEKYKDYKALYKFVKDHFKNNKNNYLFVFDSIISFL